jgi:hypothetical protein
MSRRCAGLNDRQSESYAVEPCDRFWPVAARCVAWDRSLGWGWCEPDPDREATDCSIEYRPAMILDERSAAVFINGYRQLLLEICGPTGGEFKLLERLVEGRKKLMSDGSLLDGALSRIRSQAQSVDEPVVAAASSLQPPAQFLGVPA